MKVYKQKCILDVMAPLVLTQNPGLMDFKQVESPSMDGPSISLSLTISQKFHQSKVQILKSSVQSTKYCHEFCLEFFHKSYNETRYTYLIYHLQGVTKKVGLVLDRL